MSKFLILIGVFLIVTGLFRPLLRKLRLGRLPGDFLIQWGKYRLFLPVTSSIVIGLGLTLLVWLFRH